jgi:hypothetical protein
MATQIAPTANPAPPSAPVARENWLKRLGTDAVVLGVITVVGYALATAFENGFSRHFGFPSSAIDLSLPVISSSLSILVVFFVMIVTTFMVVIRDFSPSAQLRTTSFALVTIGLMLWWATAYLNDFNWKLTIAGAFLPFSASLQIIWPRGDESKQLKLLYACLALGMSIYALQQFATAMGVVTAKNQVIFFFDKSDPNFAVVRTYGNTMVMVRFDFEKQVFTNEVKLVRVAEGEKGVNLVRLTMRAKRPRVIPLR